MEHQAHPVAPDDLDQPRDVILVRMAEQDDVESMNVPGQRLAQLAQRQLRVGASVD
jgi:hypothetical protein